MDHTASSRTRQLDRRNTGSPSWCIRLWKGWPRVYTPDGTRWRKREPSLADLQRLLIMIRCRCNYDGNKTKIFDKDVAGENHHNQFNVACVGFDSKRLFSTDQIYAELYGGVQYGGKLPDSIAIP